MKTVLTILLCSLSLIANAQDDDFRAAYEKFKRQAQQKYDDFRQKANAEYAEFVKQAWQEHKALPIVRKPKDEQVPPVVVKDDEEKDVPVEDKPVEIEEEITIPEPKPKPQPKPIAPIKEQPEPQEDTMEFVLYGTTMKVRAGDRLQFRLGNLKPEGIAQTWEKLSSPSYNNLIRDCLALRIRHNMCDWSYLRMLDALSRKLLGDGTNEAELLKAYLFCQSGYQMRLATEGNKLYMLYASEYHIFDKPCWCLDDTNFYTDDTNADRLVICKATYPHEQAMSLAVTEEQNFATKPSAERTIASPDTPWMKAEVAGDENLMAFYNDYPTSYINGDMMTRWAMYANTPMSKQVKEKLYPQLRSWLDGKSSYEAVDILCHWIQTGFEYEYDDKVWGGDRAFFADETLYYPYCDCEDRSILLTRLVRDLLGLKCALVYYPGHLATAIAVGEDAKGDYIRIDGEKFIVCDPTYIGASIGRTMPGMDNQSAKVIVLK